MVENRREIRSGKFKITLEGTQNKIKGVRPIHIQDILEKELGIGVEITPAEWDFEGKLPFKRED